MLHEERIRIKKVVTGRERRMEEPPDEMTLPAKFADILARLE
jgi:hypothetical protein